MTYLKCRIVTKMIEDKGRKFPTYYAVYAKKTKEGEVCGYMDVTLAKNTKSFYDTHVVKGKKSVYCDLMLRFCDDRDNHDDFTNRNAFITFKTKKNDKDEYVPIYTKDHKKVMKIVVIALDDKDLIKDLALPESKNSNTNVSAKKVFEGIQEDDTDLPF